MARCARCCLRDSMRLVNVIMLLFGIGMIIYSLWLQKKWNRGISELPLPSSIPRPWFIYTCLGVAIAVCLSTLCGHAVANCISNSTLCIYIVTLFCLVLLEVATIVAVLFDIDWGKQIAAYIDQDHEFESFVLFHVKMCRFIALLVLVLQVTVIILGIVLWAAGPEPTAHYFQPNVSNFTQSFLVPRSPEPEWSPPACRRCASLGDLPRRRSSFFSFIKGILADIFQQRTGVH